MRRLLKQQGVERERGRDFRTTTEGDVHQAYASMSEREFAEINGPQDWVNRRVIPGLVRRVESPGPWRVVDLGCGAGSSTRILAHSAPVRSTIDAYDLADNLLGTARQQNYVTATGQPIEVRFHHQSITDTLRDEAGAPLADAGVDLVHSAGVVGHHLDTRATSAMLRELARVVAPDGYALLDAGPSMRERELTDLARAAGFTPVGRRRMPPIGPRVHLLFRRRKSAD